MKKRSGGLLVRMGIGWLCLAMLPSLLQADALARQRTDFLLAEQAWKAGDLRRYAGLKETLIDYPLYPYLEYRELRQRLREAEPGEVQGFLETWSDTPLAEQIRTRRLRLLARRGDWAAYLALDVPSNYVWRRCNRLWAMHETGQRQQALAAVLPLWDVGHSQPDECDRLFEAWADAGRMTPERVWSRFVNVMARGNTGLGRYLIRRMPKADARLADLWIRLHAKPERITRESVRRRLAKDGSRERRIGVHVLARLAKKDVEKAIAVWETLGSNLALNARQRAAVFAAIGHYRSKQDPEAGLNWFRRIPRGVADAKMRAQAVWAGLRAQDWGFVLEWLERMAPAQRERDRRRYWTARAHEALGHKRQANEGYKALSKERGYYGFLAADRIGAPYAMNQVPIRPSPEARRAVENDAGIARARELYRLDRRLDARREWRDALARMDPEQKQAAARLADQWGRHHQAIRAAHLAGHYDDLRLRFPLAHWGSISRHAERQRLNKAWVYAVLRQESAFARDARSSAGAMGLMQLMPRTARAVARKIPLRLRNRRQLLDPNTNIRLGAGYLRRMLDAFDEHPALASAAYNAGPHRVRQWLPKDEAMPADIWIELIPFKETRNYVQRVLVYTVIYEWRMGKRLRRLSERLKDVYPLEIAEVKAEAK